MWNKKFEGWYFKHQKGEETVAFIPGTAQSGPFVQMLSSMGSKQFELASLKAENGVIHGENCVFSLGGIKLDLPGVSGQLKYGPITPLRSDIMGPFRYFPMECRHGIISMGHSLSGKLSIDGKELDFDGGTGYIEKDSGSSFPSSYLWLQCNDFPLPCSIVLSIAHIPFAGTNFTGCICAIIFGGKEYRLATYKGIHILSGGPRYICLRQGGLRLEIKVVPSHKGHPLRSPVQGQMSGIIRESSNASVQLCLWDGKKQVFNLYSPHAMYEYVPAAR